MLRPLLLAALLHPGLCHPDDDDPTFDDEVGTTWGDDDSDDSNDDAASTGVASTWQSLVDHDQWHPASPMTADPWPDHRPASVQCDGGWNQETGGIEIDTGACNFLLLQQPLPVPIEAGDPIRLRMWWQALASLEPAEGHVAVLVDGEPLWDEHVPIPGPADVRSVEFESPLSAPEGATLTLHLHNHGTNTWHFHDLAVLTPH